MGRRDVSPALHPSPKTCRICRRRLGRVAERTRLNATVMCLAPGCPERFSVCSECGGVRRAQQFRHDHMLHRHGWEPGYDEAGEAIDAMKAVIDIEQYGIAAEIAARYGISLCPMCAERPPSKKHDDVLRVGDKTLPICGTCALGLRAGWYKHRKPWNGSIPVV